MEQNKYKMTISLNVLNHLGIQLYSNVPAVLSEVVANAWDADAENVDIEIEEGKITITDDGHGMTSKDINDKYLNVGYRRRSEDNGYITQIHNRPVMGRKGIGKLSLFSIAKTIEIHSLKNGQKNGLILSADEIQKRVESNDENNTPYFPQPIPESKIQLKKNGTKILITNLKMNVWQAPKALKKRLARRFSVLGANHKFRVLINNEEVLITDRAYFHKLQYLWHYGDIFEEYKKFCSDKLKIDFHRKNLITEKGYHVNGWIGSVSNSGDLKDGKDNLNNIILMIRGKLAQEDILKEFNEGGLYTKYLIGEIHADFLDDDEEEDITTSSRQDIKKDDERYIALSEWILEELREIQRKWTDLRNQHGTEKALEIPAIKEWFEEIGSDNKKKAKRLFGKINQITLDSEEQRKTLFKHSVLAFENLKYKENLDALESISPENMNVLSAIFVDYDDIEATLYHQIVKERLAIIHALKDKTEAAARERVIQEHLYNHLWLLDPSWERASGTEYMEQRVVTEFGKIDAKLTDEEKKGRLDIKYQTTSNKHIIIELKKSDIRISTYELLPQIAKYREGLSKILKEIGKENQLIEIVCIVGKELKDWNETDGRKESNGMLSNKGARVVLYQELIENAFNAYKTFLDKHEEIGRISSLLNNIDIGYND